ncbi:MAG TPA: hypothetical protein V6C89_02820 [Drouetiella sp.]|jgi:hypothetical protein
MKDDFQNLVFNTLNGTVGKLRGNATAFEKKLETFSTKVDGMFSVPQAQFNSSSKLDPRYQELSGTLASMVSMPIVQVGFKQWKITFAGWWQAPPPFGPIIVVSVMDSLRPELKLAIKTKRRSDLVKILATASTPSDLALKEFLKIAMPNWQHQGLLANELYERELWLQLPAARSGVIELDRLCALTSSDPQLGKGMFSDWKAREAYLRIASRSEFIINGSKNLITLLMQSNADMVDLNDALAFFKSLLDRAHNLNVAR